MFGVLNENVNEMRIFGKSCFFNLNYIIEFYLKCFRMLGVVKENINLVKQSFKIKCKYTKNSSNNFVHFFCFETTVFYLQFFNIQFGNLKLVKLIYLDFFPNFIYLKPYKTYSKRFCSYGS